MTLLKVILSIAFAGVLVLYIFYVIESNLIYDALSAMRDVMTQMALKISKLQDRIKKLEQEVQNEKQR